MPMFAAERRRQIAQIVNGQGSCSISELARMFEVSEMTIHRDLSALEQLGLLRKTRGGAMAAEPYAIPLDYQGRLQSLQPEKEAIGRAAAQFIHDGDTIILEASTTSLAIVRHCRSLTNVIIYTNNPLVVIDGAQLPGAELYCSGGVLSKRTMALVGPDAERSFSGVRASKCFVGANGLSLEEGVTDPLPLEASAKRKIVEVSQEVYVVATHDKFGRVAPQVSIPLQGIDVVITDKGSDPEFLRRLTERGIRCVVA
jgi:DeoR family transcriptional regulator, fructose operon transcriptional repressor